MSIPDDEDDWPESRVDELRVFHGLPKALGRLLVRDGRPRKEIAEAAGLNASMLSGFCSGRRLPSLEHLDRLLSELGVGLDELSFELQAVRYRPGEGLPRALGSFPAPHPRYEESRERMMADLERFRASFQLHSEQFTQKMHDMDAWFAEMKARERQAAAERPRRKKKD